MKNSSRYLICVMLLSVVCSASWLFAQEPPSYRLKEAELQKKTFDRLIRQVNVSVADTDAAVAIGGIATFASSVGFLPADTDYPVLLKIRNNHASNEPVYVPYVVEVATGVVIPTATAARLLDPFGNVAIGGKAFEQILYQNPQISVGVATTGARITSELIFELWGRSEIDY